MLEAERYEEWERIQVENLDKFLELLPMLPKHPVAVGFWTDGEEILTAVLDDGELEAVYALMLEQEGDEEPEDDEL